MKQKDRPELDFDDLDALVLRRSIWGLFGYGARPFRILFLFAFSGLALSLAAFATQNTAMLPAGFLLIAVAGPLAFTAYIHRKTHCLNAMVPEMILSTFFIGGALALIVGGTMNLAIPALDARLAASGENPAQARAVKPLAVQPNVCEKAKQGLAEQQKKDNTRLSVAILVVGFIEEAAKLVFPLAMLWLVPLARRNVSIGLALGILTALGFAVLESLYYGLAQFPALSDFGYILYYCADVAFRSIALTDLTLFMRDLTTPFGHLAWSGAATIVIWRMVNSGHSTLFKVAAGLGIYLLVAVLHSLNDFFILNLDHATWAGYMKAGSAATLLLSFLLLYFLLRLAVFTRKPATVQVWEKLERSGLVRYSDR